MAPPAASFLPPPAAVPALNASAALNPVLDSLEACRSEPSLLDGPLHRLLKDDLSYSAFKDGLHRTLTKDCAKRLDLRSSTRVSEDLKLIRDDQRIFRPELTAENQAER